MRLAEIAIYPEFLVQISLTNGNVVHLARSLSGEGPICRAGRGRGIHDRHIAELLEKDCCPKCLKLAWEVKPVPMPKTPAPEPDNDDAREASLADLDTKSRRLLETWMDEYVSKKAEIDNLTADLEVLRLDKIEPLRLRLGLTKIDSEGWFIARRPGKKALDKDKAKVYLVNKGVPVKIVTNAFELATSTGKPYTEIKRKKGEKE